MCRFVTQVEPHLRLSHLCPHIPTARQLELMTSNELAVAVEFLRRCEYEDDSNREKMVHTVYCISNHLHT